MNTAGWAEVNVAAGRGAPEPVHPVDDGRDQALDEYNGHLPGSSHDDAAIRVALACRADSLG